MLLVFIVPLLALMFFGSSYYTYLRFSLPIFFKDSIYLFLEKEERRGGGKNINVWLPLECPPTRDSARNPGVCPDSGLKWQSFRLQVGAQSTEPHQPGFFAYFYIWYNVSLILFATLFIF